MSILAGDIVSQSFRAAPESVPLARALVAACARRAGLSEAQVEDVRLAVSEAAANVVLHAYTDQPGELHVAAAVAGGDFWVLIGDDGSGLRSRRDSPGLGLGLSLMAELTDELAIERGSGGGTELRMRFGIPQARGRGGARHDQLRGSVASASSPASPSFSTTR